LQASLGGTLHLGRTNAIFLGGEGFDERLSVLFVEALVQSDQEGNLVDGDV